LPTAIISVEQSLVAQPPDHRQLLGLHCLHSFHHLRFSTMR